jgi:hypothetical protein
LKLGGAWLDEVFASEVLTEILFSSSAVAELVLADTELMAMVAASPGAMEAIGSSETAMNNFYTSAVALCAFAKSDYASFITAAPYLGVYSSYVNFYVALNAMKNAPDNMRTVKPVAGLSFGPWTSNADSVRYHDLASNQWGAARNAAQRAIYFITDTTVLASTASQGPCRWDACDNDGTVTSLSSMSAVSGTTGTYMQVRGRIVFGTMGVTIRCTNSGYPVTVSSLAWTADVGDNTNGKAFLIL